MKTVFLKSVWSRRALCHHIHLNLALCAVERLGDWSWSSAAWLFNAKERQAWFSPVAALEHAGELKDTPADSRKYGEYLLWLRTMNPRARS
jgi:hypothetical protein